MSFVNIAAYKFVDLDDLEARRRDLRQFCHQAALRGTILLAPEGINLFVAGSGYQVDRLRARLEGDPAIGPLEVKRSYSDRQPFRRMLVKIKQEIIAFGVDGVTPGRRTSPKIAPEQLKSWLDEGREVTLLDTRNDYEIKLGTFTGAQHLRIDHFREFPSAAKTLPADLRERPLVMFCTGGIRCEKAGPLLEQIGFHQVYQLDGGILNYFDRVGADHFRGDCFVFDQRVAVDAALAETDAAQCFACQAILTAEEQRSPHYVKGQSCPYCFCTTAEQLQQTIAAREAQIRQLTNPLPGSRPYDNYRPVYVAGRYHGWPLVDFLTAAVPALSRERWQAEVTGERVLLDRQPVRADRTVSAGEKYEHVQPGVTEPAVNAAIRILYEDAELVVVHKPAPLPMHAGGRFNKNTLAAILAPVYAPERLRHAHRLDAHTTGVVVLARTGHVAKQVQSQFAHGKVDKRYLARIVGHPAEDHFECRQPVARGPGAGGVRRLDAEGAPAHTKFRVLRRDADGTALVEVQPVTGRTNQIRLHLWSLGIPVQGDPTYGPDGQVMARGPTTGDRSAMCLHAWRITLRHPATGEPVTFTAPPPSWSGAQPVSATALCTDEHP